MMHSNATNRARGGTILQIAFSLVVLSIAAVIAYLLIVTTDVAEEKPYINPGPLVEVMTAERQDITVTVEGYGTIEAASLIDLVPEVDGRVVAIHPELTRGGSIPAGQVVLTIDPTDYQLAVERMQAELDRLEASLKALDAQRTARTAELRRAETFFETEQAEAAVAIQEWRRENPDRDPPPLLAREPQLREKQADIEAAKARIAEISSSVQQIQAQQREARARLKQAEADLARTRITLPKAVRVIHESVDVGQYVSRGQSLAEMYVVDSLEVAIPLTDTELQWFDLPRADQPGASVQLTADYAGLDRSWSGRVVRTESQIDERTRLVRVIVRIDPAAYADQNDAHSPVPGLFVKATISGHELKQVTPLPRYAVHENGVVWLFDEGKLKKQPVEILREDDQTFYINGSLPEQARVITTHLDVVTDGMTVRDLANVRLTVEDELTDADSAQPDAQP